MAKLVFVNRFYYPDISATSQMLTDAAEHIALNHEAHVITSRLPYEGTERFVPYEEHRGVHIHRIWTTSFGRGSLIGRSFDYLTFYLGVFLKLLMLASKGDLLIAKTDPPIVSIPVSWAAKLKGAKLANWSQDLFPEVATALGMKLPPLFVDLLRGLRNWSLTTAAINIVIGEAMRTRILKEGVYTERVGVVPNWSNGNDIIPKESVNLRREWGLENQFVIAYSGNFGRAHEFDTLVKGIERFEDDNSITFLMVGGGVYMERLQALEFKNCMFKPYQPRKRLPESLTLPDLHLISLLPALEGLILPSKVYGILAAGKPLINIGDPAGEVGSLVAQHEIGFNVPIGDVDGLHRVIQIAREHPDKVAEKGLAARRLFDEQFGAESSLRKLEELLCSVI